jgi:hypothetical protein
MVLSTHIVFVFTTNIVSALSRDFTSSTLVVYVIQQNKEQNHQSNPVEDGDIGFFFAESILHDEAVASSSAKWVRQVKTRTSSKGKNNLMIILSAFERVWFRSLSCTQTKSSERIRSIQFKRKSW